MMGKTRSKSVRTGEGAEAPFVLAMRRLRLRRPWEVLGEHEIFDVHLWRDEGPVAQVCFVGATFQKRGVAVFWNDCAHRELLARLRVARGIDALPAATTVLYFAEGRRTAEPDLPLSVTIGPDGQPCEPTPVMTSLLGSVIQALPEAFARRMILGPFRWRPVRISVCQTHRDHWLELRPGPPRLRAV